MAISKILNTYTRYGKSLEEIGLNEAAVSLDTAIGLLPLFANVGWRILGGDIYELDEKGNLRSNLDSWYYDGLSSAKSIVAARVYLENLVGFPIFVVFVIEGCLTEGVIE